MTHSSSLRIWISVVALTIFILTGSASLFAQANPNSHTDIQYHKFVPIVPPENSKFAASSASDTAQVSSAISQQIQLLMQEKASRTPAQQKIDSNVLYTIRMMRGQEAAPGVTSVYTGVDLDQNDRIVVDIVADVTDALLKQLEAAGALILDSHKDYRAIRAIVPPDQIEIIAASPAVTFIGRKVDSMVSRVKLPQPGHALTKGAVAPGFEARAAAVRKQIAAYLQQHPGTNSTPGTPNTGSGSVDTEGDATHQAARARGLYGVTGAGLKIGVLSDSANNTGAATLAQATGDLPPTCPGPGGSCLTIVQDKPSNGTDEGAAMLEIVHDLVPGATLFFATADISEAGFATNILNLRSVSNCDIIVDDVFYFDESPFQDGVVAQAVTTVTTAGAMYFSSAGNEGNVSAGTAGYFEGDFNDTGSAAFLFPGGTKTGTIHNFGSVATPVNGDIITGTAAGEEYTLNWADPAGASGNDYDLFLVSSAGTIKAQSTNIQSGTQNPFEGIVPPVLVAGDRLVVFKVTAAAPVAFALNTLRGTLTNVTTGQTHGHSAVAGAFSVAAAPAAAAFNGIAPVGPFPNAFTTSNLTETFTSDGPRRQFFNANGTAITPGNFLFATNGGAVIQKPDVTAADGVTTTLPGTSGLNPFYGTSAAAPHAASIAALILSAKPTLTPAQIRTTLTSTALDIDAAGYDNVSGNGIVMALAALNSLGITGGADPELGTVTANENPGNGNGIIEPGEGASLVIQLKNQFGAAAATGITATLSTITPGVTISQPATSAYADLAASTGAGNNLSPFTFTVASNAACGLNIEFTLTVTFTGGSGVTTRALSFNVQTGLLTISNTLGGATPIGMPAGMTFVTGTQTGRLFRSGTSSVCGTNKTNPGLTTATGSRTFDAYTLTPNAAACLNVTLTAANGANMFEAAYNSGGFVPATPNTNYLADPGNSGASISYGVSANAGTGITFVVHELNPAGATGSPYTLTIPSCVVVPAGSVNHPPTALAHNVTVTATTFNGTAPASIDNGSSDPDAGDTITKTQNPPGPYPVGVTSVILTVTDSKGAMAQATANVTVVNPVADLTITKTHTGNFTQGQTGANYTITVTNSGAGSGPTSGTVTVVDTLPASMTATALAGTGWTCTLGTLTCTRADALAATISYPTITLTVTVSGTAPASVTNTATVSGGGETNTANDVANDTTTIVTATAPELTITKTHVGNFTQGQSVGSTYTITVTNSGGSPTTGTVTVLDTLPGGMTANNISSTGWTCGLSPAMCTRADALAAGASYPAITITVTVPTNAPASLTNSVTVSGGGETNTANDTATDPTTITQVSDMTINKTHVGNFAQGQVGAVFTITATNSGTGSTSGTVTVVDTIPAGLTATAMAGTGWSCTVATATCTRSDVLAPATSYPAITLTVTVAANAASPLFNNAAVSGGGEVVTSNDLVQDQITVTVGTAPDMTITKSHVGNFTQGQVGATYTITATNSGNAATTGTVTVVDTLPTGLTATAFTGTGWTCTLATVTCTRADAIAGGGASYPAITLNVTVAANAPATVTNSVAVSGGGETNTANDSANDLTTINTLTNPVPTVTTISPTSIAAGSIAFTLTVNGTNFVPTSVVHFNGSAKVTTFVSSTQLTAQIQSLDVSTAGNAAVFVSNPTPGGGSSNSVNFTISGATNPLPSITGLTPNTVNAGSGAFTLTVSGTNFISTSVVDWLGSPRPTTFVNATTLTAAIAAADIQTDVAAPVVVVNPAPGGGTSNTFVVNVITPTPTLTTLVPNSAIAGGAAFTLTVNGTSFENNASVLWNGSARTTTFVSATQVTAAITAADIANVGTASVEVFNPNPTPGGANGIRTQGLPVGTFSNVLTFTITAVNPVPVLTSISPNTASAGSGAFTLTVNGSGFIHGSVVNWGGSARTTTFVSATQLTAAITAADIQTVNVLNVNVFNPAPGGGTSVNLPFTITTPVPAITTLTPNSAIAGGAAFTLTVTGSNFINTSVVQWNGGNRTTTFVSATSLQAAITAADILTAGTASVRVFTPTVVIGGILPQGAPSGTTSNALTFTITATNPLPTLTSIAPTSAAAGGAAFTLTLNGTNFLSTSVAQWKGSARTTTFVSATQLTAAITAADIATSGTAAITVVNPTPGGGTSNSLTFTVTDFSVTSSTGPQTVTAGQLASFAIATAPVGGAFAGNVTFTTSALPQGAAASFSPSSVPPGTPTTMTITTTARGSAQLTQPPSNPSGPMKPLWLIALLMTLALTSLTLAKSGRIRARRLIPIGAFALLLISAGYLSGCSGGGFPKVGSNTGTPAGTYPITVTGTSGTVQHSVTVTLIVQ